PSTSALFLVARTTPVSNQPQPAMIAQHQTVCPRALGGMIDLHVAADHALLDPLPDAAQTAMFEDDTVLDLTALDDAVVIDGCEGPQVAIADDGVPAHDQRAAQHAVDDLGAVLHHDLPLHHRGGIDAAFHAMPNLLEDQPVCLQHVAHFARVNPGRLD